MISSTRNFAERQRHNIERVMNMSFRWAQKALEIRVSDEVACYETTLQACQRSEAELLTSRLGIHLPYRHQYLVSAAASS
jgi:hypothetical protein